MIAYQLFTLPTRQTLDYFKRLFTTCPFDIDWEMTYVELNMSVTPGMENNFEAHFSAVAGNPNPKASNKGFARLYDPAMEMTNLYLPLTSPDMEARAEELREAFKPLFHPKPFIYMVVKQGFHNRVEFNNFVNSISDMIINYQTPLEFEGEFVRPIDVTVPNDQGIYEQNGLI